jgi:hypothetical protein
MQTGTTTVLPLGHVDGVNLTPNESMAEKVGSCLSVCVSEVFMAEIMQVCLAAADSSAE